MSEHQLSFYRTGASSNLDFYRSDQQDKYYAEVLINSLDRHEGKLTRRKVPIYHIYIYTRGVGRWDMDRFTYTPKTKPRDTHLSDRTVTRLIRARLKEI